MFQFANHPITRNHLHYQRRPSRSWLLAYMKRLTGYAIPVSCSTFEILTLSHGSTSHMIFIFNSTRRENWCLLVRVSDSRIRRAVVFNSPPTV